MNKSIKAITLSAMLVLSAAGFAGAGEFTAAPLRAEIRKPERAVTLRGGASSAPVSFGYRRSHINWDFFDSASDKKTPSVLREAGVLPSSYDNRKNMPPVTNQSPYENCWTHSATATASASLIRKGILEANEDALLSEWYLTYFGYNDEGKALPSFTFDQEPEEEGEEPAEFYNTGGTDWIAVALLSRGTGAVLRKDAPSPAPEKAGEYVQASHKRAFRLTDAQYLGLDRQREIPIKKKDMIETVKRSIMENGAVSAGIEWPGYPDEADVINRETSAFFTGRAKNWTNPNHAITLVGWDDSYPKENFNTDKDNFMPEHDGAWILRNSWGEASGDAGHYYISYEEFTLCDGVAYIMEKAPEKETLYQYDPLGCADFIFKDGVSESVSAANIFTAESDAENIDAVAFYTAPRNQSTEVTIYTGCNADDPVSGTKSETKTVTFDLPGYHTVTLDKPVKIKQGELFSIVVKYHAQGGKAFIPVEGFMGEDDEYAKASSGKGESWIATDSGAFSDLYGVTIDGERPSTNGGTERFTISKMNVCIKAIDDGVKQPGPEPEPQPEPSSGGSSGCNAGAAGFALLFFIPAIVKLTEKEN